MVHKEANALGGWYVSHLGEVKRTIFDPGRGWSRLMDIDQLPDNYHPEHGDIWAHGVVAPNGESLVVPMRVIDGRWQRDGDVQYLETFYREQMAGDVGSIRGVGNKDGQAMEQEVWYERKCVMCRCTEDNPCIDSAGNACSWAEVVNGEPIGGVVGVALAPDGSALVESGQDICTHCLATLEVE